jgi:hypothetical protein
VSLLSELVCLVEFILSDWFWNPWKELVMDVLRVTPLSISTFGFELREVKLLFLVEDY